MTRAQPSGLFDVDPVERRRGCTDLVPIDPTVCHRCGVLVVLVVASQPALFFHGGYGETKRGTVAVCPDCGWVGNHTQESTNPRHPKEAAS